MLGIRGAAPVAEQEDFMPGGDTGHQHIGGRQQDIHLGLDGLPFDADAVFQDRGNQVSHGGVIFSLSFDFNPPPQVKVHERFNRSGCSL
jgi:hypothetical protein